MKKIFLALSALIVFAGPVFAEFPAVEVYGKTSKSVVLIIARSEESAGMVGAGSIIKNSGMVATNAHVIIDKSKAKPYSDVNVYLKPDKVTGNFKKDLVNRHKAKVLAYDVDLDLAILQLSDLSQDAGIIEMANPEEISIGEEAVAIGHPEQGGLWTLTYGRISGEIDNQTNIEGKDVFQTDASVNRGNSGGPLLDRRGYMIGINSNMARLGAGDLPITGVNFAVKSSVLKTWLEKQGVMIAYGKKSLLEEKRVTETPPLEKGDKGGFSDNEAAPKEKQKSEPLKEEKAKAEPAKQEEVQPADTKQPDKDLKEKQKDITAEKKKGEEKKPGAEKKPVEKPEEKYQPQRTPYDYEALLKTAEEELEDMMQDIKGKIRK
ncbi:MAG: trypsin-like peptidase domain-containing protein [Nitrospirae bacterium]|nr:trypsin-like peptidase domain-containing protein [Nitrospirota bacterium]